MNNHVLNLNASQKKLPLLKITENGRFFQTENGDPFFYLAETGWEIFHRATREEADLILSDRASKGFNVIQATTLAERDGLRTPNSYGHLPFTGSGLDPTLPNEPYWDHVDWVINHANALGIYVALLPAWGDKWCLLNSIGPEIFNPKNAKQFSLWLSNRYKNAGIIWLTGGDRMIRHNSDLEIIRGFAEGLKQGDDGRHLQTYHPYGGKSSSRFVHAEPWLDFHMLQSGVTMIKKW